MLRNLTFTRHNCTLLYLHKTTMHYTILSLYMTVHYRTQPNNYHTARHHAIRHPTTHNHTSPLHYKTIPHSTLLCTILDKTVTILNITKPYCALPLHYLTLLHRTGQSRYLTIPNGTSPLPHKTLLCSTVAQRDKTAHNSNFTQQCTFLHVLHHHIGMDSSLHQQSKSQRYFCSHYNHQRNTNRSSRGIL